MKPWACRFAAAITVLIVGGTWITAASAQERFEQDLTLRKTYLKTNDGFLPLSVSAETPAFEPTPVHCPTGSGCTIRIQFSAVANLLEGVPPGFELSAHTSIRVDGHPAFSDDPEIVFPNHQVLLGFAFAGTSTFTWVTYVEAGDHTIDVIVRPQYGGTGIFLKARTLAIDVYKR